MAEYLQWHPAFVANLRITFDREENMVELESEHNLGSRPMQIDVLLKKKTEGALQPNIGRLFKRYNVIEYKSPDDYLSIDDYYKVYGYACFYKAEARKVNGIPMNEVTITFVCRTYPRKLSRYLRQEKMYLIEEQEEGIYYIRGDEISMQIVVTSRLSEEKNFWLKHLTNNIKDRETAKRISEEYWKHHRDALYKSMMNVIVNANREIFEEVKDMCEALRELFKEELEAGWAQAAAEARAQGMEQGIERGIEQGETIMCQDIEKILENPNLNAEKIIQGIKEYIASKNTGNCVVNPL